MSCCSSSFSTSSSSPPPSLSLPLGAVHLFALLTQVIDTRGQNGKGQEQLVRFSKSKLIYCYSCSFAFPAGGPLTVLRVRKACMLSGHRLSARKENPALGPGEPEKRILIHFFCPLQLIGLGPSTVLLLFSSLAAYLQAVIDPCN